MIINVASEAAKTATPGEAVIGAAKAVVRTEGLFAPSDPRPYAGVPVAASYGAAPLVDPTFSSFRSSHGTIGMFGLSFTSDSPYGVICDGHHSPWLPTASPPSPTYFHRQELP